MNHDIKVFGKKLLINNQCGFKDNSIDITFAEINKKIRSETKWEKIKRKFLYYWKQL